MSQTPFEKGSGDRRRFFRALFHRVGEPIADAIQRPLDRIEEVARQVQPEQYPAAPGYTPATPTNQNERSLIRPPGALPEPVFLTTCQRSGKCAEVCPVGAIKFLHDDRSSTGSTPYIEPEVQACVACIEVPCAIACPTGALHPLSQREIKIGLAEWSIESCLISMGQECRECVSRCPFGAEAIELDESTNMIVVKADHCTGCGVCQMHCPTYPKAIIVKPL